jgi:hypothetical protein
MTVPDLDTVIAQIAGTAPSDVEKQRALPLLLSPPRPHQLTPLTPRSPVVPLFKKLDKAAEQASTRTATATAATSRSRGAASSSSSTSAPPPSTSTSTASTSTSATAAPAPPAAPSHLLQGLLSNGQDPLDVLSPYQHSIGYLYVLCALSFFFSPS